MRALRPPQAFRLYKEASFQQPTYLTIISSPCPPNFFLSYPQAFRLYTEASFQQLPPSTLPEIQRTNLASVVLQVGLVNWQCGLGGRVRAAELCQCRPCACGGCTDQQRPRWPPTLTCVCHLPWRVPTVESAGHPGRAWV